MPDNFRYIFTEVENISQCVEIAARHAEGEYLIHTTDDVTFSENFVDKLDAYTYRLDMNRIFIGFRYKINSVFRDDHFCYNPSVQNSPLMGVQALLKKEVWHNIGGLDRRFVIFADMDMRYRLLEQGYSIFITPDCWINEEKELAEDGHTVERTMYFKEHHRGEYLLNKFWFKDGMFSGKRLFPVLSFDNEDILLRNQLELDLKNLPNISLEMRKGSSGMTCPTIEITGGIPDRKYFVEFINAVNYRTIYELDIVSWNWTCCFPDETIHSILIRVSSIENGTFFEKKVDI
jgi:hypothetical protein